MSKMKQYRLVFKTVHLNLSCRVLECLVEGHSRAVAKIWADTKYLSQGVKVCHNEHSHDPILIAAGCGRTSLIKSIVQLCEDIVHVDPLTPHSTSRHNSTTQEQYVINEIYASTKPYPSWWSEIDESRILKRRKSVGDFVLERNVCFIDTLDSGKTDKVISYLEQQFLKTINALNIPGTDLTALLSGKGGNHVDVVLYLMTPGMLHT
jgi:hypothetical protein